MCIYTFLFMYIYTGDMYVCVYICIYIHFCIHTCVFSLSSNLIDIYTVTTWEYW